MLAAGDSGGGPSRPAPKVKKVYKPAGGRPQEEWGSFGQGVSRSDYSDAQFDIADLHSTVGDLLQRVRDTRIPFDPNGVSDARRELAALLGRQEDGEHPGVAQMLSKEASYRTDTADSRGLKRLGHGYLVEPGSENAYRMAQGRELKGYTPDNSGAIEDAQVSLATEQRRLRGRAIKADRIEQKPRSIKQQVDQLSWDEYEALSPRARAAVDFNTQLVTAVRRDLKLQDTYSPSDDAREHYDEVVEKMFGEDRGSGTYAPETLALLQDIKFKDAAADLDDFLSLKASIKQRDLAGLDVVAAPDDRISVDSPQGDLLALQSQLVDRTLAMQEAMVRANTLIGNLRRSAVASRQGTVSFLGGRARSIDPELGYRPLEQDAQTGDVKRDLNWFFASGFGNLSDSNNDVKAELADIQSRLSADEFAQFMSYADARTRNTAQFGGELFEPSKEAKPRTPEQLRRALGFERGATDGD